jgi:aspartyl-tRNA(Asn)/glutamyl-tRNA(Gln) amidotransferase subunit A
MLTLSEAQAALAAGSTCVVQLTREALALARVHAHLNIFLELFDETALECAAAVDAARAAGTAGPLVGAIVSLKDNICYQGHKVSASSRILEGYTSPYSATVVERLLAAGAVIIGRTNCDEFAMGSSNENSAYGNVLNPLDPTKVPGGSSGGAAASVAAGICTSHSAAIRAEASVNRRRSAVWWALSLRMAAFRAMASSPLPAASIR